ncbi:oxidoreductase [Neoasaia chiangmaiensis NBRC 101099]|uniref:Oxidoreductase n=1 Tax=Neoasaia chiangmaiensis TaxID=320497 RepID=A0A1U9KMK8_9PROT|nr:NAD(P)/FAD-dependent oxidoreductase [Neoasaia chiangmaiensis]AQS86970.1 oxidoreductase [Neoasaia chiangmaiensis]GBR37724.1 oxidoreductase [Neoasaia chiangmaiensis NBRC 101099]GEN15088.1 FAD-dependent urate hydroxylase [Neoasaia chiangmaiensis]
MTDNIESLTRQVARDLDKIAYATGNWSPPCQRDGEPVLDVAIIGAGQGGLATAFALRRFGIHNVRIFERASNGGAGPWTTFARMITLRTPKHVTGPDLGIPSLTPRAWFEARYGEVAWQHLDKISRHDWQAYLDWFRDTLNLPVTHETALTDVAWDQGLLRLTFMEAGGATQIRWARKLVLATGIDGGGMWHVPSFIRDTLPADRYAHTHQEIDFAALHGKRIGVLGGGASAFDNAATALEAGAATVDLCIRRQTLPRINPYRWMENAGFLGHFHALPDLTRWRFMRHIFDLNQPPPQDTFWRCSRYDGFRFHGDTPWLNASMQDDGVLVATPHGEMAFDFVIIGTGFIIDLARRPETAGFAPNVALWRDCFAAPPGEESAVLGSYPYLGSHSQFLPRDPDAKDAEMLAAIHNFTFSATPSMGLSGASISGMRFGVERLARGLACDLFVTDGERHLESLLAYDAEELTSLTAPPDFAGGLA